MKYRKQWIDHRVKKLNKCCGWKDRGYNQSSFYQTLGNKSNFIKHLMT